MGVTRYLHWVFQVGVAIGMDAGRGRGGRVKMQILTYTYLCRSSPVTSDFSPLLISVHPPA